MDFSKILGFPKWLVIGAVVVLILAIVVMAAAYWRMAQNQTYWSAVKQTASLGLMSEKPPLEEEAAVVDEASYYPGLSIVTPTPMNYYVSNDTGIIGPEALMGQSQQLRGLTAGYTPTKTSGLEVPGSDEFNAQVEAHNLRDLAVKQGKYRFAHQQDIFRKAPITDRDKLYVGNYSELGPLESDPLAGGPWAKKSLREYVGVNYNDS